MNDWRDEVIEAVEAFKQVATLGKAPLADDDIEIEFLEAPHRPPSRLPLGRMAVYGFWGDGCWLKVGLAGPKSNARYTSQHYNSGSAPSTLAMSLLSDARTASILRQSGDSPGQWLRESAHRVNILMRADKPRELLALLEAFLHLRLQPRHER
jgi:hypothetical protein